MTAKAVTFAVQIGSGGYEIAHHVAETLKYSYYDWEVTSQAASEAGVSPETVVASQQATRGFGRFIERLLAAGAFATEETALAGPNAASMATAIRTLNSSDYRKFVERVVDELGGRGEAVIVGHASQFVLAEQPGVLKVLVVGSPDRRAERLSRESGTSKDEALAAVKESDKERQSFFRDVYKANLLGATHYDLTLSTDSISLEAAADLVVQAAYALPGFMPEAPSSEAVPQAG
jgi:cytidylate kinase